MDTQRTLYKTISEAIPLPQCSPLSSEECVWDMPEEREPVLALIVQTDKLPCDGESAAAATTTTVRGSTSVTTSSSIRQPRHSSPAHDYQEYRERLERRQRTNMIDPYDDYTPQPSDHNLLYYARANGNSEMVRMLRSHQGLRF